MTRTGHVEFYSDKNNNAARRFWMHDRILCGGSIVSQEDYDHLRRDLGVTGVMSFCDTVKDEASIEDYVEFPFPDNGNKIPAKIIHDALSWARDYLARAGTVLYVHCALGGSRGPSMSYAVCRGVLKMEPNEIFEAIEPGHPTFLVWKDNWYPKQYLRDIEEALLTWSDE